MSNTPNKNAEDRKNHPAQATQASNTANKQMGEKPSAAASGPNAGQAKPAQAQQQSRFSQQHDADKSKSAPSVDKDKIEADKKSPSHS